MPDQYSIQDQNRFPSQLVHSGTENAATTIRRTGQTEGAADTHITGGTVTSLLPDPLGSVVVTAGTESPATGFNGGTVSIGTAAVELTFTGVTRDIFIQADQSNGTMVFIGPSSVTQTGANAVARLDAGETISLDLDDANAALYAVGGTTAQKVYKLALT